MSIPPITPIPNTSTSATGKTKSSQASQSNFMTLLVAQLKNQDPLSPATNEQFIAQLAQLESLDESKKISGSLATMVSSGDFSSASALIGKNVSGSTKTATGEDVTFNGTVSSVSQEDGKIKLKVTAKDGTVVSVTMAEISEISQ